jgi:hypothetical protein
MSPSRARWVANVTQAGCIGVGVVLLHYFALDAVGWDRSAWALSLGALFIAVGLKLSYEVRLRSLAYRLKDLESRWLNSHTARPGVDDDL